MATTVSLINMKGGVGKTTLAFNLAWFSAWQKDLKVLAVDLDPQANLSQYFLGATDYLAHIENTENQSVVDIFEQYSPPIFSSGSPTTIQEDKVIVKLADWRERGYLHLIPSRLELAWTLKNPTGKSDLLPRFLADIESRYDLIIIDCAPTESILSTAAYKSSRYVFVPVRPEFLATIGLPLLGRSLGDFKAQNRRQDLDMAGIIYNGGTRSNPSPAQSRSYKAVNKLASEYGWPVFEKEAFHSMSYQTGSLSGDPIFHTDYARSYVVREFNEVGLEFLNKVL